MGGKKKGKIFASVLGFAFGAGWLGGGPQFGAANAFMGGMYGASLTSNIWSMTHKPKVAQDYGRFDQLMNSVNSESAIPIVYGIRRWSGYQTWKTG
jgi:hypothetical protein